MAVVKAVCLAAFVLGIASAGVCGTAVVGLVMPDLGDDVPSLVRTLVSIAQYPPDLLSWALAKDPIAASVIAFVCLTIILLVTVLAAPRRGSLVRQYVLTSGLVFSHAAVLTLTVVAFAWIANRDWSLWLYIPAVAVGYVLVALIEEVGEFMSEAM